MRLAHTQNISFIYALQPITTFIAGADIIAAATVPLAEMARDISANTEMQRRIEEFFGITKTGIETEAEPAPPPEDESIFEDEVEAPGDDTQAPTNDTDVDIDLEEESAPLDDESGSVFEDVVENPGMDTDFGSEEVPTAPAPAPEDESDPFVEDDVEEVARSPDLTEGGAQPLQGSGAVARQGWVIMVLGSCLAGSMALLLL